MPARPSEDTPYAGSRIDRGRANRLRLQVPVQLRTDAGSCVGVTNNLGPGGVFVATTWLLRAGDRVTVTLELGDDAAPVEALAEVRWCRAFDELDDQPAGVGLLFIDTPLRAGILMNELRRSFRPPAD